MFIFESPFYLYSEDKIEFKIKVDSSGQYKINEQFVGLPVILSSKGVEKIVDIELTEDEHKELLESASHVKELCDLIDSFGIL